MNNHSDTCEVCERHGRLVRRCRENLDVARYELELAPAWDKDELGERRKACQDARKVLREAQKGAARHREEEHQLTFGF